MRVGTRLGGFIVGCVVLAACGLYTPVSRPMSESPTTTTTTPYPGNPVPTSREIQRWTTAWCALQPGMSKKRAIAAMGQPTERPIAGSVLVWYQGDFDLLAYLDIHERVTQLQNDDASLTAGERALFTCGTDTRFLHEP